MIQFYILPPRAFVCIQCENPACYWSALRAFACLPQQDRKDTEKLFYNHYCYLFRKTKHKYRLIFLLCDLSSSHYATSSLICVASFSSEPRLRDQWSCLRFERLFFLFFFFSPASLRRIHCYCVSASFNLTSTLMWLHWFLLYCSGYLVTRLRWAVTHNPLLWLMIDKLDRPEWIASLGMKKKNSEKKKINVIGS